MRPRSVLVAVLLVALVVGAAWREAARVVDAASRWGERHERDPAPPATSGSTRRAQDAW